MVAAIEFGDLTCEQNLFITQKWWRWFLFIYCHNVVDLQYLVIALIKEGAPDEITKKADNGFHGCFFPNRKLISCVRMVFVTINWLSSKMQPIGNSRSHLPTWSPRIQNQPTFLPKLKILRPPPPSSKKVMVPDASIWQKN